MVQKIFPNSTLTYLVATSFLGLFLALMFAFYVPTVQENLLWRKPAIGLIFGSICVLGILAVFSPKHCSKIFDFAKEKKSGSLGLNNFASHGTSSTLKGHHPDCENFSAHVFRIGDRMFCTACTGLLLGGLLALAGTFSYFFSNWRIEQSSFLLVWAGILGVGFGLFQFKARSLARFLLNTFFVFGAFLLLIGIDELARSATVDLFLIALTLFWLFTRISLSQWDHRRICYACKVAVCEFADKRKRVN